MCGYDYKNNNIIITRYYISSSLFSYRGLMPTSFWSFFRRLSTVHGRTPNWNNAERKNSAVLLDALIINKSQSAAVVVSDTGQVATIVVQQPSLSANSPEQSQDQGCHTAPVELPIDFNRWPEFANSLSTQQYHDFQMKWVYIRVISFLFFVP